MYNIKLWKFCLLAVLMNKVVANCNWENQEDRPYCGTSNHYKAYCQSTVNYDSNLPLCRNYDNYDELQLGEVFQQAEEGLFIINLSDPNENPFLEDVASYIELTITDGSLITVPMDIYKMKKLTNIKISGNDLHKVNLNDFLPLSNLKIIDLSNNNISVIEVREMPHSSNISVVQDINVSYNLIEIVPNKFIRRFSDLKYLNLSHNMISVIDKHAFDGATTLKTLDLSHNRLQEVGTLLLIIPKLGDSQSMGAHMGTHRLWAHIRAFKDLGQLSTLFLNDNSIKYLNFTEFLNTNIEDLCVSGNKIPCEVLAKAKYADSPKDFDRVVTTKITNYNSENVNGIPCQKEETEVNIVVNFFRDAGHPNPNLISFQTDTTVSSLIPLLKNTIENINKSLNILVDLSNKIEKTLSSKNIINKPYQ